MTGIKKDNPDNMKETYGLFLKQTDVNFTFTNLVLTDKNLAIELSKRISLDCGVSCIVVDESFSIVDM